MATDWTRVRELFDAALDLPADQRTALLSEQCGDDQELREHVERLLRADAEHTTGAAIDQAIPAEAFPTDAPEQVRQIGDYTIQRVIGSGGMSTVFEAEQDRPRRTVALKTVHLGLLNENVRRRFEQESEVLARLRHPAIAQIHEVGTWTEPLTGQAVPFFAMEYVEEALPFDRYLAEHDLALQPMLELFLAVCDAVHHGHQLGVIHRDLKPANVLVDARGRPKVIDFGIARATDGDAADDTLLTRTGQVLGTLPYMAPEQLDGRTDAMDTRVDVYALGVMLYQVLTGALPFPVGEKTITAFTSFIREHRVPPPSTVRGPAVLELDWIVNAAMAPERNERYASVSELAADLRRFLAAEPVSVGPPSGTYHLRKFIRRNRILVGGAAAVLVALVLGVIGTTWQMFEAQEARDDSRISEAAALRQTAKAERVNEFLNQILQFADPAEGAFETRTDMTVREALDLVAERIDELENEPDVEADVRFSMANAYRNLGQLDAAETHARRCLELRRMLHGTSHEDICEALWALANVRTQQGELADAATLHQQALTVAHEVHVGDHEQVALSHLNVGKALRRLGKSDEAKRELSTALEMYQRLDGDYERFISPTLSALGLLAERTGALEEAKTLYREALLSFERADKSWHPFAADTRESLGWLLHEDGDDDTAAALLTEALEIQRRSYGPAAEASRRIQFKLGRILNGAYRYAEATEHLRAAEAFCAEQMGDGSRTTIEVRWQLSRNLRARGEGEAAVPFAKLAYQSAAEAFGDDSSDVVLYGDEYAEALLAAGELAEAAQHIDGRLVVRRSRRDQVAVLRGENQRAVLWTLQGRLVAARPEYESLLARTEAEDAAGHALRPLFQHGYGRCLTSLEEFAAAEVALLAALDAFSAALPARHHRMARLRQDLAAMYDAWGRPDDAQRYRNDRDGR